MRLMAEARTSGIRFAGRSAVRTGRFGPHLATPGLHLDRLREIAAASDGGC